MDNLKKYKNVSGGMLLEIILMLAIMMSIFPIMQRNIKKRTDSIRNQMVVKDMLKLKGAVETYLKKQPNLQEGINDIDLTTLIENGLPVGFKKQNVLNQIYKVRVKVKKEKDLDVDLLIYDAIIIATGNNDISPMRIREIVKEAKGYAGYVENSMVYGPSWQFNANSWKKNNSNMDINEHSLVLKTGLTKDDDKYIYRSKNSGSSSMRTDLYMGFNNILGVNNIFINGELDTTMAELKGQTDVKNIAVAKEINFNNSTIKVREIFNFIGEKDKDINFSDFEYVDNSAIFTYLSNALKVQDLLFNGSAKGTTGSYDQRFRSVVGNVVDFSFKSTVINKISKFIVEQASDPVKNIILNLKELDTRTFNVKSTNNTDSFASVVSIVSMLDAKYVINNGNFSGHDVIVKKVNRKIMNDLGLKKLGGIDITEKTPLSVVLRGIHYSYCDMYKLIHNQYPQEDAVIVKGWYCNLHARCEYAECQGQWYH